MSFVSLKFVIFLLVAVIGFYSIPKRWQWAWLLAFSYVYYAAAGLKMVPFLLFSTLVSYSAGIWMDRIKNNQVEEDQIQRKKRYILLITLILNFGMLVVMKYTNFAVANLNFLFGSHFSFQALLLPLGISFYTFQSAGYIIDVYWEKFEAEKNFFRFALFVSFFPQLLQGPIGRFDKLAHQLYEEHSLDWSRMERSLQRILWGFFKKMVVADNAARFVDEVFARNNFPKYSGTFILVAILGYSIQLYGDFSGGMDIVKGVALLFGIELDENFKRPYFATSLADFWHRWHITLGTWMKDYVFYPISLSKTMNRFGKFTRKVFGKNIGRAIPIGLANLIVFFLVGVWHGANWKYIVYGLFHGSIIAISGMMMLTTRKWKSKLHIPDISISWRVFQIARTFLLVNISWYFDRADDLNHAFALLNKTVTDFHISDLWNGKFLLYGVTRITPEYYYVVLFACLTLFVVSYTQEKGIHLGERIRSKPIVLRFAIYLILLYALPALGTLSSSSGGFIYAQF
jgi:D-alanyl-lipoteichoic acid acyltransferase DltB (MBOAT superfamily)